MEVFSREQGLVKGLTDNELIDVVNLYTDKIKAEIIHNLEKDFSIKLELTDELISYFNFAIDQAMTKGMELAANTNILTNFHNEHKEMIVRETKYNVLGGDKF